MNNYRLTINGLLEASVMSNKNQEIIYRDRELTYEEFYNNVKRLAGNLLRLGVKNGDRIGIIDFDTINYMYAYYAVPMIGATLHMVNIRYPPEILFYTIQNSEDKYIIVNSAFMPLIMQYKDLFSFVSLFIIYSENGHEKYNMDNYVFMDDLLKENDEKIDEPDENSIATLFYTSGTTGLPKGVYYTHKQLILHSISSLAALSDDPINFRRTDTILPLVPMFHVHAWGIPYFAILKGMKYIVPGKYDWPNILNAMEKYNVNVSAMVPSILYLLLSEKNGPSIMGKLHLKTIIGGAAITSGLADLAEKSGMTIISGYGMSETGPIITLATYNSIIENSDEETKKAVRRKTGIPIPMVRLRVVSGNHDVEKNENEIGEIILKAPWLTSGYFKDDEKTKKLWQDGWLHTGDLAVMDKYGYIKIVDRESDAIKSGGEFIPSVILEDLISTVPGVDEVAVVAYRDQKWGERPAAFIKGSADEETIRKKLNEYVDTGRIAKFWMPDRYYFVENFEKTGTGKIDKKILRERVK